MTKKEAMEAAANREINGLEGVIVTRAVMRDVFLNGWIAADAYATTAQATPEETVAAEMAELRNAIGTLGEGIAEMLKRQGDLSVMGLRGADRGVSLLNAIKDVGEKVEATMTIATNTEEGIAGIYSQLEKLGVEKWREAIKHVERSAEGQVYRVLDGERPYLKEYISEIGKEWAKVPVNLEDVNDATLKDLATTEQIDGRQYWQEVDRRQKERLNKMAYDDASRRLYAVGLDPAKPGSDTTAYQIIVKNPATFRDVCAAVETVCEIARAAGVMLDFSVKSSA